MKYQVKTNKGIVTIETKKPIETCSECPIFTRSYRDVCAMLGNMDSCGDLAYYDFYKNDDCPLEVIE